jgi:protein gp37
MGENSKIEWCDHTFNPWIGCQKVSPECDHCYAEAMMDHRSKVKWGPHGVRHRTSEQNWRLPIRWNAQARAFRKENRHRPRVFCASLADVFDNQIDTSWRDDLFALIQKCNKLDWLVLTKRPENIEKMLPPDWGDGYCNVWLGTTAEDQTRFDARWKRLKKVPAVIRFLRARSWTAAVAVRPIFARLVDIRRRKRSTCPSIKAAMGSRCHRRLPPFWCCAIS